MGLNLKSFEFSKTRRAFAVIKLRINKCHERNHNKFLDGIKMADLEYREC